MKMSKENLQFLQERIEPLDTDKLRTAYREQGLSPVRYMFDLFYKSKVRIGDGVGMSGDIVEPGLNDEHLETALRTILAIPRSCVVIPIKLGKRQPSLF
jgi:hypothetical protein